MKYMIENVQHSQGQIVNKDAVIQLNQNVWQHSKTKKENQHSHRIKVKSLV